MAKMLRNTPGVPGNRGWCCRCRQCRHNNRRGFDSEYRRGQRHREKAEVRAIERVIASNARYIPGEPAEDF